MKRAKTSFPKAASNPGVGCIDLSILSQPGTNGGKSDRCTFWTSQNDGGLSNFVRLQQHANRLFEIGEMAGLMAECTNSGAMRYEAGVLGTVVPIWFGTHGGHLWLLPINRR